MKSLKRALREAYTKFDRPGSDSDLPTQHIPNTEVEVDVDTDMPDTRIPTQEYDPSIETPLSLSQYADAELDKAPDRKAAVQLYSNLEKNLEGFLLKAIRQLGSDSRTAKAVVSAWMVQNNFK